MRRLLVLVLALHAWPVQAQYSLENALPLVSFDSPVDVRTPDDGTGRLFVVERPGTIQVIPDDLAASTPGKFLDITNKVESGGELGLLSLAFHPDYATNRQFFVYYTAVDGSDLVSIIERYEVSADPDFAFVGSAFEILRFDQPAVFHNGGQLAFGSDGYLYLSTGDGGFPASAAQDRTNLLGAVIRLDVDGGFPYAIPPTNPYFGNGLGYREEIYAYGLRNPWRMAFDPVADDLWLGDVGEGTWEEIDIILPGRNYGWNNMEGDHCTGAGTCPPADYEGPVHEYSQQGSLHTVVGGVVYRGSLIPALAGTYIFGDFGSGNIWSLDYDFVNPAVRSDVADTGGFTLSSFGVDADGEVLVVTLGGSILRLTDPNAVPVPDLGRATPLTVWPSQPNPFNPRTVIRFGLAEPHPTSIVVYDLQGRRVRVLARRAYPVGEHRVSWDGRDDAGDVVVSGVYIAQIQAGPHDSQVRMVLTK